MPDLAVYAILLVALASLAASVLIWACIIVAGRYIAYAEHY